MPSTTDSRGREPLLALQVLRFFAAGMVMVHHAGYDADTLAAARGVAPLNIDRWFDGTFGVPIFFVLSGFIMVFAEPDFDRPGESLRFLRRRLIRIVPLYWLLTTAVLVGGVIAPSLLNQAVGGWTHVLGSYAFVAVQSAPGQDHPVLGQGWTLNYEMFFYLLFAAAMAFSRRVGLALLVVILLGLMSIGAIVQPNSPALQTWTSPLLLDFLFGVGVALARERGLRCSAIPSVSLVLVGLALGGFYSPHLAGAGLWPTTGAQGVAAGCIVSGLALGPDWPPSRLVRVLATLGAASYSLYLVHPFAIRLCRVAWAILEPQGRLCLFVVTACTLSMTCALLLYRLFEQPSGRFLRSLTVA